jgi:hypothetical protein
MVTARKARLLAALGFEMLAMPAAVVATASLGVVALAACASCHADPASETLPGVRLGMAPRDVRDRFDGGGDGAWQTLIGSGSPGGGGGVGASDDTVVEWTASNDHTRVSHARFEFHLGMLVAVRAHLRQPAVKNEPRTEITPKTVTVLVPAAGGTDVTMLARDCPTHREEAESLVAKGR